MLVNEKCVKNQCNNIGTKKINTQDGSCICKTRFNGEFCDICDKEFNGTYCNRCSMRYRGKHCKECTVGFAGQDCEHCAYGFIGEKCDQCDRGFKGSACQYCDKGFKKVGQMCVLAEDCSRFGAYNKVDHVCLCKPTFTGELCKQCITGYSGKLCDACDKGFHMEMNGTCLEGDCDEAGTRLKWIDGTCVCKPRYQGSRCGQCNLGYTGEACNICESGYYQTSTGGCIQGECHNKGTERQESNGICTCKPTYAGHTCDHCAKGFRGTDCDQCRVGYKGDNCDICDEGFFKHNDKCHSKFYCLSTDTDFSFNFQ